MPPSREAPAAAQRRRGITWVIAIAWAYAVIPSGTQVILSGRPRSYAVDAVVTYAPAAAAAGQALQLILYGALLLATLHYASRTEAARMSAPAPVSLALALAAWILQALLSVGKDQVVLNPLLLVFPFLVFAIAHGRPAISDFAVLGQLVAATATLSVLVGLALPSVGTIATGPLAEKSLLGAGALAGPFPHSNTLGVFLALGLPSVLLLRTPQTRFFGVCVTSVAIVWSASRTSWLAAAIVLLGAAAFAALRHPGNRRALVWLSSLVTAAVVVIVPLGTVDPMAYTTRGGIWMASLERWRTELWFGGGPSAFSDPGVWALRLRGVFHAHNLFVQFAAVGGVAMLVIVSALLWRSVQRSATTASAGERTPYLFLVAFVSVGLLEVPTTFWEPSPQGVMAWLALTAVWFAQPALLAAQPVVELHQPDDQPRDGSEDEPDVLVEPPSRLPRDHQRLNSHRHKHDDRTSG